MSDDTLTVRDHSKPCKHDKDVQFPPYKGANYWLCEVCPGGRAIVLRKALGWEMSDHVTTMWVMDSV
jgi:hypothetical protein